MLPLSFANAAPGSVALVTGAAQGAGQEIARALAVAGRPVAAVDRDGGRLRAWAAEEPGVVPYVADVADPDEVNAVVAAVERELGPIALLVNAAGVLRTGAVVGLADAEWAEMLGVNAGGVFHAGRAVAARMMPRRAGAIVTVSPEGAGEPRAGMGAYAASKAAAAAITRSLGLELAPYGIRCEVFTPVATPRDVAVAALAAG